MYRSWVARLGCVFRTFLVLGRDSDKVKSDLAMLRMGSWYLVAEGVFQNEGLSGSLSAPFSLENRSGEPHALRQCLSLLLLDVFAVSRCHCLDYTVILSNPSNISKTMWMG